MIRKYFTSQGLTLSYLDNEQVGRPILVCVHGHGGSATYFSKLMASLTDWHVYSLDRRGHGWSDHAGAGQYSPDNFVQELFTFIQHIGEQPVVLLGHSIGGIYTYFFAAKYPHLVRGMIIEDIGVDLSIGGAKLQTAPITDSAGTLQQLKENLVELGFTNPGYIPTDFMLENAVERENGWQLRLDKNHLDEVGAKLAGIYWDEFLQSTCPTLLLHGRHSILVNLEHIQEMAARRPHTEYYVYEQSGHCILRDEPQLYIERVKSFLEERISIV